MLQKFQDFGLLSSHRETVAARIRRIRFCDKGRKSRRSSPFVGGRNPRAGAGEWEEPRGPTSRPQQFPRVPAARGGPGCGRRAAPRRRPLAPAPCGPAPSQTTRPPKTRATESGRQGWGRGTATFSWSNSLSSQAPSFWEPRCSPSFLPPNLPFQLWEQSLWGRY